MATGLIGTTARGLAHTQAERAAAERAIDGRTINEIAALLRRGGQDGRCRWQTARVRSSRPGTVDRVGKLAVSAELPGFTHKSVSKATTGGGIRIPSLGHFQY